MKTVKATIYKLHFTSPLHIGDNRSDYGVSLKTIQSDTMYAAVTSCLAKLGENIPDGGDLGCTISSLFPFYQERKDTEAVYFFPKPLKHSLPRLNDITNAKKVKKVVWMDLDYFKRTINGESLFEDEKDIDAIKRDYLTDKVIADNFISSQVSPRVTVSRLGKEYAIPFYMDRIYFKDYSGLFFIIEGNSTLFEEGLRLLQYEGIGTDRNVGNGYFEYESSTIELSIPEVSDSVMSLSMFIPENQELLKDMIQSDKVAYDFVRRGGWITDAPYNTIRKNVIYAFTPASVFDLKISAPECFGKIVNLRPSISDDIVESKGLERLSHPIWRCGRSIFIPVKL